MKISLSKTNKTKLTDLGVGILYLFGSRARNIAGKNSDYDVGVVFIDAKKMKAAVNNYSAIYEALNDIFPERLNGPKLDISFLQNSNAALQMSAIRYGKVFFEINPRFRADYEESVLMQYDDYRFLQKEYEEATFSAFQK